MSTTHYYYWGFLTGPVISNVVFGVAAPIISNVVFGTPPPSTTFADTYTDTYRDTY